MSNWKEFACAALVAAYVLAACAAAQAAEAQGDVFDRSAVAAALSDEGLTAAAVKTDDRLALYGLAWLAEGPAGGAIIDKLVKVSPADAPAAAALRCRSIIAPGKSPEFDVKAADAWLAVDGDNGAAHCFKAYFLESTAAIVEVKTGLAAKRFEIYDTPEYRKGIFKALDVLDLKGTPRLYALVKAIERRVAYRDWSIFGAYGRVGWVLRNAAKTSAPQDQAEIGNLLLKIGGKLQSVGGTEIEGAYCSYMAIGLAYAVMRDAATDSDVKKAYDLSVSMENMAAMSDDAANRDFVQALDLAAMLPGAAASVAGISPADKPLVDAAVAKNDDAIRALIAAMPDNPDDLAGVAVVYNVKTADALVNRDFPKVAAAAKAVIDASEGVRNVIVQASAPERSKHNIKDVGLAIGMYEADHKELNPPDLKTLITDGYVTKGMTIESPITGRPYVFLRPNAGWPKSEPGKIVLAYDDAKLTSPSGDWYVALFVDLHVGGVSAQVLQEQLKNPPK